MFHETIFPHFGVPRMVIRDTIWLTRESNIA
jgi:hypothetical protein